MEPILRSEVAHLPGLKTLEVKTKAGVLFFSACLVICLAKHINQIESLKVVGHLRKPKIGFYFFMLREKEKELKCENYLLLV